MNKPDAAVFGRVDGIAQTPWGCWVDHDGAVLPTIDQHGHQPQIEGHVKARWPWAWSTHPAVIEAAGDVAMWAVEGRYYTRVSHDCGHVSIDVRPPLQRRALERVMESVRGYAPDAITVYDGRTIHEINTLGALRRLIEQPSDKETKE